MSPRIVSPVLVAASLTLVMAASAAESQTPSLADITLEKAGGEAVPLQKIVAAHRLTVVVFFSETCPCFAVHTERLRDLARELSPKGVDFVVVDSERHAASDPRPAAVVGTDLAICATQMDGSRGVSARSTPPSRSCSTPPAACATAAASTTSGSISDPTRRLICAKP